MIQFESSIERDWIIALDSDPTLRSIHNQPFIVEYYCLDGNRRYYTPNFQAAFEISINPYQLIYVYEVKYRDDLRQNWKQYKPRFEAALNYCRSYGLKFQIITEREICTPFVKNATFLRRYREYPQNEGIEITLLSTLRKFSGEATPSILLLGAYAYELNRIKAIAYIWKLLDSLMIRFDQNEPLTMDTLIWLNEET